MFDFESFRPGEVIGARDFVLSEQALQDWLALFPEDRDRDLMPPGMMAAVSIRAYSDILSPRPPGNVHAAQEYRLLRRPRQGARLTTKVRCAEKEIRKDRRWVTFDSETTDGESDQIAFTGRMIVIWAA